MSGIKNIKTGLSGMLATAVLAAALVLPAGAIADEGCSNTTNDPTAAQYCSVGGENEQGNGNQSGNQNANQNGGNQPNQNGVNGTQASGSEPVATAAPSSETVTVESSSGSLPFTGLDVGILAAVAVALVGTGLLLRRLTASGVTRS